MSWDEIGKSETQCPCGKGKVVIALEADDWNRSRTKTEICCPVCQKVQEKANGKIAAHETKARDSRKRAEELAKKRFLNKFQQHFAGCAKTDVWKQLHKGSGYPALGTFYAHIRSYGSLEAYLERHFLAKLESYFPTMFRDPEVEALLERAREEVRKAAIVRREYAKYLPHDD